MLFGSRNFREAFMRDVERIAGQKGMKLVFGSLIGSLPQGIQCYDSDYDSVFLYLNEDFPEKLVDADESEYEDVLYRYYPEDPLSVYDSLTYREFTSFLGFLKNPSIHHENRDYGLYYYFADVLFSPFAWDPYGLQMKLAPVLRMCYHHPYMVRAYVNKIRLVEKSCPTGIDGQYNYKFYIRKFLYAFYLEWALTFHDFAPAYLEDVLLYSAYREEAEELRGLLERYRAEDIRNYRASEVSAVKEAHLSLVIEENALLEKYCSRILERAEAWLCENAGSKLNEKQIDVHIANMVQIVRRSIGEEPVKGVWTGTLA